MRRKYRREGRYLCRVGADDGCIWCGMPDLPGFLTWARVHERPRDLRLSPDRSDKRAFRLCWSHHHGCYDQNYITTKQLIEAEDAWIAGRRPKPHLRDRALVKNIKAGRLTHDCRWTWRRDLKTGKMAPTQRREAKAKIGPRIASTASKRKK
jgi:hypothetical protein